MECVNVRYERVDSIYEEVNKVWPIYGIVATETGGEVLFHIPDISIDAAKVDKLVERLMKFDISPVHAFDVLEDSIVMLYDDLDEPMAIAACR